MSRNNYSTFITAYHGTGRNCNNNNEIKKMIMNIFNEGFKNGYNNAHANCNDIIHPGNKVGIGVYVTPNIEIAKGFAGIITFEGQSWRTLFMVKVRKDSIRMCNCSKDFWVVNGNRNDIFPEKFLYFNDINNVIDGTNSY